MRRAWPAAEIGIALAAAIGGAALAHAIVVAIGLDARDGLARGLGPMWAGLMIGIAVAAHVVQHRSRDPRLTRAAIAVLAGVAAGFAAAPLMAGLLHTPQPPYGVLNGDQTFRTEYVTRFASTWQLDDYTFRGLEAFYPPAWFWLAGRTADVLGVVAWHVVKPFTIGTLGAALLVAYALWRAVLTPAGALSAAIGSSLSLTTHLPAIERFPTQGWYSPYSCFVAVTGVAWLAATVAEVRGGSRRGRLAVLAVAGAVLALTYYLLFVVVALALVVLAAVPRERRRAQLRRAGLLLGAVAALTALFWVPLVIAVVRGAASQGHFFRPDFLEVSAGVGGPAGLAVLAAVAIVLLVVTSAAPASQAVAAAIGGLVLYQLLSVATLTVAHDQLQPHRAATMLATAFGAAVPVAVDALGRPGTVADLLEPRVRRAFVAGALALAVPALFALGAQQGADEAGGPLVAAAYRPLTLGTTDALSAFITTTARRPPDDLTIITAQKALLITKPYFGFLPIRARYAHPEADLPARIAVVRAAAACPTAACTTRALGTSRFGPVDAVVLVRVPFGFRLETDEDAFPDPRSVSIAFERGAFDPADWVRRDIGVYSAFVRRP